MSDLLQRAYETVKPVKKQPFGVETIMDSLMGAPLNLDISQIIHTPQTVIVKKAKEDYINEKIAKFIKDRFCVIVTCRADMLIFSGR